MNDDVTTAANRPARPAAGLAVLVLIVAGAARLTMPACPSPLRTRECGRR